MGRVNGIKPEAQRLTAALILELTILGLKRAWQGTERELTLKTVTTDSLTRLSYG